jgi:hypothetical protein
MRRQSPSLAFFVFWTLLFVVFWRALFYGLEGAENEHLRTHIAAAMCLIGCLVFVIMLRATEVVRGLLFRLRAAWWPMLLLASWAFASTFFVAFFVALLVGFPLIGTSLYQENASQTPLFFTAALAALITFYLKERFDRRYHAHLLKGRRA